MMMLIKTSWRNIWRNKKRSFIIMGAVSLGLWMGIFLMSFYNGMIEQRVKTAITTELSHIQLHHPEFRKDYDVKYILPKGREACEIIKKNKNKNQNEYRSKKETYLIVRTKSTFCIYFLYSFIYELYNLIYFIDVFLVRNKNIFCLLIFLEKVKGRES